MMMNIKHVLIAASFALLAGCGKGDSKPDEIVNPVQAKPSGLYPKPLPATSSSQTGYAGWVGDVMPYWFDNQFQIFFLHDATDQMKQTSKGQHPIHRFTSADLLTYKYEGEVVPFGDVNRQDHLVGTGSVVKSGATYYCYFTGHNGSAAWTSANPREAVLYSTSTDLKTWTKKSAFRLTAPSGYSTTDFRDPNVFYNEEFAEYWMVVSTQKSGKAVLLVFTTKDLATDNWSVRGTLPISNSDYLMMECAEIFKSGDKYYLLFAENWSSTPGTRYRVASSTAGPWEMPSGGQDMFDGHQFYAGRSVTNGNTRYTMGWAHRRNPETNAGALTWGGNLITHELYTRSNGDLAVRIPASITNYFNSEADPALKNLAGEAKQAGANYTLNGTGSVARFGTAGKTTLIKGNLTLSQLDGVFTIGLNATDNTTGLYTIQLQPKLNKISGFSGGSEVTRVPFTFTANKSYSVKIVIEDSIVVLYLDDQVALTNRIYGADSTTWTLSTSVLGASVNNLKITTHK